MALDEMAERSVKYRKEISCSKSDPEKASEILDEYTLEVRRSDLSEEAKCAYIANALRFFKEQVSTGN